MTDKKPVKKKESRGVSKPRLLKAILSTMEVHGISDEATIKTLTEAIRNDIVEDALK